MALCGIYGIMALWGIYGIMAWYYAHYMVLWYYFYGNDKVLSYAPITHLLFTFRLKYA